MKILFVIYFFCLQMLSVLFCTIFDVKSVYAQTLTDLDKAQKIEQICYFVDLPENKETNDVSIPFKITVIGKSQIQEHLQKVYQSKTRNKKKIKIVHIEKIQELQNTDILFIANSEGKILPEIFEKIKDRAILTISDSKDWCSKGVMVNFYESTSKFPFEINYAAIRKAGIRINALVLENSKIIDVGTIKK